MAQYREKPEDSKNSYGQRSGDAHQQPWTGANPNRDQDPHTGRPLSEQARPDEGGVRMEHAIDEQPSSPDETNSSAATAGRVREDVTNTSDSSGLRADDEASGEATRDLLRRGATEVSRMD